MDKEEVKRQIETARDMEINRRVESFARVLSQVLLILDGLNERIPDDVKEEKTTNLLLLPPTGTIVRFHGNELPNGFLWLCGAVLKREEYEGLFETMGYSYGGKDEYFNLPDFRERQKIDYIIKT